MFGCISKKSFSSKLYSNVANLQKLKTLKIKSNKSEIANAEKSDQEKTNSNVANYLSAYSKANHTRQQVNSNYKKLEEIKQQIKEKFLKKTNNFNFETYEPSSNMTSVNEKKKIGKEQQLNKFSETNKANIIDSLNDYYKINYTLYDDKTKISEYEEIMDLSSKLNNEKYSAKIDSGKNLEIKNVSLKNETNSKFAHEKKQNVNKQTILKNSHVFELYYYTIPFANQLLSPHKYKEPFGSSIKENQQLKQEFEYEQETLNSEIHTKLIETVEKEMKGFKLSNIKSNVSLFKDPIKNQEPIKYMLEESNRLIDYDDGIEIERLFYVVNKEDDFGATMYKEEGEKKKPKESSSDSQKEDKDDTTLMRTVKHFPYTTDNKIFALVKNSTTL